MSNLANTLLELDSMAHALANFDSIRRFGVIKMVSGLMVESDGPNGSVGDMVWIYTREGERRMAEVVGLHNGNLLLIPYEQTLGISIGCKVEIAQTPLYIGACDELLGRVIDGFGKPIDNKGPFKHLEKLDVKIQTPKPLTRPRIEKIFQTGIKAIDGLVCCGEGQRMGILPAVVSEKVSFWE